MKSTLTINRDTVTEHMKSYLEHLDRVLLSELLDNMLAATPEIKNAELMDDGSIIVTRLDGSVFTSTFSKALAVGLVGW
jgi:hypothetical protein